ncbi:sodium-dependent transporter [Faecalibacterium gallinarum]|uniref:Sodium-dependent transporter n=1 Tax=Faecalibacterium gallinarum TaxID=2903556 RepID=A0AA37MZ78_9FIRM|nr:sodium-dependent transporter [Faecalibacterium gallinarum]GJN65804.1 sodium-dependent transporter [Faecalibacterium gallinarum]
MKRENFSSRLGFILVSAGCAIGIGNVWKFPWMAGSNGGGVFVLFYLLFLIIMGVPVLTMELAVGRASRKSAVLGYKALEPQGSKWHIHGWFCVIGCCLLMMYYTTVAGWMLDYFYKFATGAFEGMSNEAIDGVFSAMLASPSEMGIFMVIIVLAGFLVCSFGLQKGLERISKWMMLALLALIVVLAVNSILLDGGAEGLKFYLLPDLDRALEVGLGNVITAAMNQSFFTLSLGIAAMEIFGSYMSKDHTLPGEAVRICALDTFVALMSGLIIFPACFAFGVQPDAGPSLIFMTLPRVFVNMAGGRLWGALFFLFMTFASFTTVLAVFENIMASCIDNFGWSRKKATVLCCIFILLTSLPCVLGYNLWYFSLPLPNAPAGGQILDIEDFLVSNLLLPLGSLVYLLFCVSKWGWGYDKYLAEANTGEGLKLPGSVWLKRYLRYVLPVLILVILIQGLF